AGRKGLSSIVDILLKAGADINARDDDGYTALMLAAQFGHTETLQRLLTARADIEARDKNGETALMKAASHSRLLAVKALIASRARVNSKDNHGITALMKASYEGHREVVEALLAARADPSIVAKDGSTAMSFAQEKNHAAIIELLLNAPAPVKSHPKDSNAPSTERATVPPESSPATTSKSPQRRSPVAASLITGLPILAILGYGIFSAQEKGSTIHIGQLILAFLGLSLFLFPVWLFMYFAWSPLRAYPFLRKWKDYREKERTAEAIVERLRCARCKKRAPEIYHPDIIRPETIITGYTGFGRCIKCGETWCGKCDQKSEDWLGIHHLCPKCGDDLSNNLWD
ncbi:MAG TPA: ankyrin repeat domain-containing protein, partial [Acidobacteriota bacterium]|nr:ankyrin repeat domain-containing protein [Acidobacteriota bacterium]